MTEEITIEIDEAALEAIPVFPLPGTVLLPQALISLHIFEPRYRQMMKHCLEGHRVMAIAMLDEHGQPDVFGRPPIHPTAGLGYIRRSARLPDGRYNVVLEGVARLGIQEELPPRTAYRRVRAEIQPDRPEVLPDRVRSAAHALRALATRVLGGDERNQDLLASLSGLEPGQLADNVASAALEDATERQRVLATVDVEERLAVVSGALGASLFESSPPATAEPVMPRWGIVPGKA